VLEHFVADPDEFLDGVVGAAIVERVQRAGGVLSTSDLRTVRAEWTSAASARLSDAHLFATPAPTHGQSLLDAVVRLGSDHRPAAVHRAVSDAIAHRKLSLADPSGTSMVSAVDSDGTMITLVHSHSYPRFGSGLIVDGFDLILANRAGRGFTAESGHPNFPVAGRRPATTLHAWGLRSRDGGRIQGATPGGANQMPWNAQSIAWILGGADAFDAHTLADAVVGPRWQLDSDGGLTVEAGFERSDRDAIDALVGSARHVERWGLRSAMQIVADSDGVFTGVVDPRTVGVALPM
jgi:gamma-glutamyltranspeptidase/glutathione hydrolase